MRTNAKIKWKNYVAAFMLVLVAFFAMACASGEKSSESSDGNEGSYKQITQDEAKEMMEKDDGHVIVDVRTIDEYKSGHIPEAINIPNEGIGSEQPDELPDLEQIILIYCRSGNRSKQASEKLAKIGYTNIYEFGGINDWTGETVTE